MIYLFIANDKVVASYGASSISEQERVIESVADYAKLVAELCAKWKCEPDDIRQMCSSTMHFPQDFTTNKATIALAEELA